MTGRQWLVAGGSVLLVGALGLVALGVGCAVLVRRQVDVRSDARIETFEHEVAAVLSRLGGTPALIEDTPSGPRLSPGVLEQRKAKATTRPHALWVLVWDQDERKIVRLSLPFWLLRLSPRGVDIDVNKVDLRKLRLSVDDLERAGPGPLFVREDAESRVLVWTE